MHKIKKNQLSIIITSLFLGILIIIQAKSFTNVGDVINRNTRSDVFRELQILKDTNDKLRSEIGNLKNQLNDVSNSKVALENVKKQIDKYSLLDGEKNISGPGVKIIIDGDIQVFWLTDIINELYLAGAEFISVNSILLTNSTIGFDTIPNGQILLNGIILNKPYVIEAIGDRNVLHNAIVQPQGIFDRIKKNNNEVQLQIIKEDLIEIQSIS